MVGPLQLRVDVTEPDSDLEELERETRSLRAALLELDVEDVTAVREGAAPEGTKAVDPASVGALMVTLIQTPELVRSVVNVLTGWLRRGSGPARRLKVSIDGDVLELQNASADEQRAVVESWLARHGDQT